MEKTWIIYIHRCKTTNKCYVGQTCRKLEKRWGKNGKNYTEHNNLKFYNAIQKYGWEDFEHFIVAQCNTLKEAYELERYYIDKLNTYKNGYNSTLGGAGSKGKVISKELREHLSKLYKGKETRGWKEYFILSPMFGRHHTEETKRKIGNANRGRVISKEGRERMRLAKLGKKIGPMSEETKNKLRLQKLGEKNPMYGKHTNNKPESCIPVIQYDKNGNFVNEFSSLNEAQRQTGIRADNIRHSIKRNGTAGGYIWKIKN